MNETNLQHQTGEASFDWSEFPRLETPRLILREARPEDREGLFGLYADEEVMRYIPLDPFEAIEEADDEMGWHARIFRERTGLRWMIEERDTGEFVGTCGFLGLEREHNRMEIGYDLTRSHWGKGMMPEAIRAVLDFGFDPLDGQTGLYARRPPAAARIRKRSLCGSARLFDIGGGAFALSFIL